MGRKKIGTVIEKNVLINSKRRCALCFGLKNDLSIKQGQIAHIDKDNTNNSEENLLFLCLDHHDEYDSITSQSKNITKKELEHYRDALYEYLVSQEFMKLCDMDNTENWDKKIFREIHDMLYASNAMNILQNLTLTSKFSGDFLESLEEFTLTCEQNPSFCFKNKHMDELRLGIYNGLKNFMNLQSISVQYDVDMDKFQLQNNLDNYFEVCQSLDQMRALACSNYFELIKQGVQLGY